MCLTGPRRTEAAGLRRTETETVRGNGADIIVWRLPAARSKNKREVVGPGSAAALAIIEDQPQIGDCGFVFTLDGNRPMSVSRSEQFLHAIAAGGGWGPHALLGVCRGSRSR